MWHYRGPHQIEEDGGPGFADGWSPWHRQNGQVLRHLGIKGVYPLVNIQKAIENGHRNSGFSHEKW